MELILIIFCTTVLLSAAQFRRTQSIEDISERNKNKRRLEDIVQIQETTVRWDNVNKVCIPDICKGKHLDDIPSFDGYISNQLLKDAFASNNTLFDKKDIQKCFQNKKVVFFGDSTMTEITHALFYAMTGIFRSEHHEEMNSYVRHTVQKVLHQEFDEHFSFEGIPDFYVTVGIYGHRNFSLHVPALKTDIYCQFNGGGVDLNHNFGGIKEMVKTMPQDFLCFLGNGNCPVPDIIVYQSGHHDVNDWRGTIEVMPKMFQLLSDAKKRGTKVYWKSSSDNYHEPHQDAIVNVINQAAELLSYDYGISYINIDIARDMFAKYDNTIDYLEGSVGPHSGLIGGNNHPDHPLTYLMWKVLYILNDIC